MNWTDLSCGEEPFAVAVEVDGGSPPEPFKYCVSRVSSSGDSLDEGFLSSRLAAWESAADLGVPPDESIGVPIVVRRTTDGRGWGAYAGRDIAAGAYVCTYAGAVVRTGDAEARQRLCETTDECNYVMVVREYYGDQVVRTNLDPTKHGNVARFINHSHAPNLTTRIAHMGTSVVPLLALFAHTAIQRDTELTFSYANATPHTSTRPCHCRAPACPGFLPRDPLAPPMSLTPPPSL